MELTRYKDTHPLIISSIAMEGNVIATVEVELSPVGKIWRAGIEKVDKAASPKKLAQIDCYTCKYKTANIFNILFACMCYLN